MARLNDEGQWIVMMGFIICVSLFFLAIVVNESTLVGQTTAGVSLTFGSVIQEFKMDRIVVLVILQASAYPRYQ